MNKQILSMEIVIFLTAERTRGQSGEQLFRGSLQHGDPANLVVEQGQNSSNLAVELLPDLSEVFLLHGDAVPNELRGFLPFLHADDHVPPPRLPGCRSP